MATDLALKSEIGGLGQHLGTAGAIAHAGPTAREPILSRLYEAFLAMSRRQQESEVAMYIRANGGELTDDLERQISRKFGRMVE